MRRRALIEIRMEVDDGPTLRAYAHDPQVAANLPVDPTEWMVNPRKDWVHPGDPIVFSARVRTQDEGRACEFVDQLLDSGWSEFSIDRSPDVGRD